MNRTNPTDKKLLTFRQLSGFQKWLKGIKDLTAKEAILKRREERSFATSTRARIGAMWQNFNDTLRQGFSIENRLILGVHKKGNTLPNYEMRYKTVKAADHYHIRLKYGSQVNKLRNKTLICETDLSRSTLTLH